MVNVQVAAVNYFGRTASSTSTGVTVAAGQVVDVVISPVTGAMQYNIYGLSSTPTTYLLATCGGVKYTLQGSLPTAVSTNPTADTGTGAGTRMEGVIPTLSGVSATAGIYPAGWQGGYVNQSVGTHLSTNAIFTALDALWENNGLNNVSPGVFKADPSEIVADGGDLMRLANDMLNQGNALNYLLSIDQSQIGGIRAGAAVAEFVNPVTRSTVKLTVHPWMSQGTALLMSYQLPQTWSHVDNAWEMTCVQDYVSVAWPVIDASFRYSIFLLGSLISHAPMYSGILQGLQVSDTTPFS